LGILNCDPEGCSSLALGISGFALLCLVNPAALALRLVIA